MSTDRRFVRRRWRRGVFAVLVSILGVAGIAQQPSFRSTVQTVAIYATVRDSSGRLVADLGRHAFTVLEDGRPVDLAVFSADPLPLSVAIMLDTSESVLGLDDGQMSTSVLAFLNGLQPQDRASLGTFGLEIAVGANLTNDRQEIVRVLNEEVWKGGGTPVWEAIRAAITSLKGEPGRRVVLILSDGEDTGGLPGFPGGRSGAEAQSVAEEVMVYAVAYRGRRGMASGLAELTEATGGGHFEIPRGGDLRMAFERLAEELRHQYLLGFVPRASDGVAHKVEVRMSPAGLVASTRRSFVAPRGQ